MDYKEIDKIFYRDGYRLAAQFLDENLDPKNLKKAINHLYQVTDELLEAFLVRSETEGKQSECKKGCDWCCHQTVFAVTHEFLYLHEYVEGNLPEKSREKMATKARDKVQQTLLMSNREQLRFRAPCPFLESGSCMIYEARPMACRIYLSSSVKACIQEHQEPDNEKTIPELFGFPLRAGRMLNEGFVAYLKQRGLQSAEWTVEHGYASLITMGQTMESWIKGRSDPK
jgi:Fe-S-cluster containining protein